MAVVGVSVHRIIRGFRAINPIHFVALILLAASEYASAQDIFGPIERSCRYKKAYAVVVKLLAVYASHVLTIKLEPGLSTSQTVAQYITAALLPAATATCAIRDLWFRRSGFQDWPSNNRPNAHHYKNMQKAINARAVCVRIKKSLALDNMDILSQKYNLRAKTLKDDNTEVFVRVPPGTPATLFVPTLISGNSQLMQAVLGAIQLALATLQLVSVNDPRVAAYGYGSFVYTIIPYAVGSSINAICAILTSGYNDITEMDMASDSSLTDQGDRGLF